MESKNITSHLFPKADVDSTVLKRIKEQYDQEGYCVVDNVYSGVELDEMETFFEDFKNRDHNAFGNAISTDEGWEENYTFNFSEIDPSKELLRAMHPHRFSQKVKKWYLHPKIGFILMNLLGCPALGAQTMYYYKPPQSVGQGMHQDNFYLLSTPATCIAAWTPIDDTDEENGCLKVVRGSQNTKILCPPREGETNVIAEMVERSEIVPIYMQRGQTLFFNGQLIHGSSPNKSLTRSRRTFIGHYVDSMTERLAKFYHPILDMDGNKVSNILVDRSGGPCQ